MRDDPRKKHKSGEKGDEIEVMVVPGSKDDKTITKGLVLEPLRNQEE